jgi:tetratricopeptide (TPR) repeat protein
MPDGRRSLQEILRSRRHSGFVGRRGQLDQYRANLSLPVTDEHYRFLFNVHGIAGVGKTYLTKQLREEADGCGAITAYCDDSFEDITSVMSSITKEFGRSGIRVPDFEKRLASYQDRRNELTSDPDAPGGIGTLLTRMTVTAGIAAGSAAPVVGPIISQLNAETIAGQLDEFRKYVKGKFKDYADVRLVLSPADELTPGFVSLLNRAASDRPVALFFDTYERTAPVLDGWLRDLYAGKYGDLPAGLNVTIAGQHSLDPNLWGEYFPMIADLPLQPFSDTEARQFLANKNITDDPTIEVILSLSGCLPMWLETLAESRPAESADVGDPSGLAIDRFLRWEHDPARQNIAKAAALPRTLNEDVLAVVTPGDQVHATFDWLCRLPFVSRQAGAWRYHEVVRSAMLRLQHDRAPSQWRTFHNALAQANRQWADDVAGGPDAMWSNAEWVSYTREATYHLLCANPEGNLPAALTSVVRGSRTSVISARQWAQVIADAGRDTADAALQKWGQRLHGGIGDGDLTEFFSLLINEAPLDADHLVLALEARGVFKVDAGRYSEALTDFDRAIELKPSRARTIANRGALCRLMRRYDEALADLDRALEFDPDDVEAIGARGDTYIDLKRYEEALADFDRCVVLRPENAPVLISRGETYRLLRRYEEALADFNRAIEIQPDSMPFAYRGQVYRVMGNYDQALADYDRAIGLKPDNAWALGGRGLTYDAMGRHAEALADFTRAIELDPDEPWAINRRGHIYLAMDRYEEALADFDRAIDLDPTESTYIAGRALIHQELGHDEEALVDVNRLIDGLDGSALLGARGELYRSMGRYDEALSDLNQAIDLYPGDSSAYATRGATYLAIGRHDEALANLNRALDLKPGDVWSLGRRGQTYAALGRFDEAIADYTRALELEPESYWILGIRGMTYLRLGRPDEALADLDRSIDLNPASRWRAAHPGARLEAAQLPSNSVSDLAKVLAHRAEAHELAKRYDQALADLNQAIEVNPGYSWAISRREEINRLIEQGEEAR